MSVHQPLPAAPSVDEPLLRQLARTYHELLAVFERAVGISAARARVLFVLRREGELSQASLQQRFGVDGAAVTRTVKQLAEEGLVTRRDDPRDNRFMLVQLTAAGRRLADDLASTWAAVETLVVAGLHPDELAVMRRCLQAIRANARTLGGAPAACAPGAEAPGDTA